MAAVADYQQARPTLNSQTHPLHLLQTITPLPLCHPRPYVTQPSHYHSSLTSVIIVLQKVYAHFVYALPDAALNKLCDKYSLT